MKNFFTQIRNIWNHEELRKKLGITLGLILVYRIGSFIVIPGVNSDVLAEQMASSGSGGLGDLLSFLQVGHSAELPFLRWASCLTSRHPSLFNCSA